MCFLQNFLNNFHRSFQKMQFSLFKMSSSYLYNFWKIFNYVKVKAIKCPRFIAGRKSNRFDIWTKLPSGGERGGDLKGPGSFWSKSTRPSTCKGDPDDILVVSLLLIELLVGDSRFEVHGTLHLQKRFWESKRPDGYKNDKKMSNFF